MKQILLLSIFTLTTQLLFGQFKQLPSSPHVPGDKHHPEALLPPVRADVPSGSSISSFGKNYTPIPVLPRPLSGQNGLMAYLDGSTGTPFAIKGTVASIGDNDRERLTNYLQQVQSVLKLANPPGELALVRVVTDDKGYKHYYLQQVWNGVEVFGAEARLHQRNGEFYLFNGRLLPTPDLVSALPVVGAAQALEIVREDIGRVEIVKELSPLEKQLGNYNGPETKLVVYFTEGKPGTEKLAWSVQIVPNLSSKYQYFVDAKTGEILHKFNSICKIHGGHDILKNENKKSEWSALPPPDGPAVANAVDLHGNTQTINTYEKSNLFYLIDASRSMFNAVQSQIPDDPTGVILTLDAVNTSPASNSFQAFHITSADNSWSDPKAVSAHFNGGKAYEYFKGTFGRESINGEGGNIISLINVVDEDGSQMDNAFWSGAAMFYGNGNQGFVAPLCKSLDVAGHEMSHGVIQSTANLLYQDESGALNESFADIFGVMIDRDDWQLGEDVVNSSFFPTGALRDMSNPHNGGSSLSDNGWQPAHYSERYTGNDDNGGVHINSGIVNKAFFNFASDPAVGKDKAEQVYYRALTEYLFKSAQFIDCRVAVVQAANDLYGSTVAAVAADAFSAVGIGSGSGSDPQTDIDPNPGEDFVLMTDDNFSQLYIFAPDGTPVANPLTTTSPLSRPSVTDDGEVVVFVDQDNTMRAITIDWNSGQTNEQVLSSDPIWRNVAISRDGARLAALTTDYDNLLWVYDFTLQQWQSFELYNPTTGQGGPISGDVQYADVIEWDYTGEWVMYDALNVIPTGGTQAIDYWDISFINVWDNASGFFSDGFTDKLFSLLPEDVSVGNPTFSKNSDYIISFDYLDEFNNDYFILGANVETGDVGTIFENSDLSWPNYSVDDGFMVFDAFNNSGTPVLAFIQLANDKISPAADPFVFIEQGRRGVWFANGERILVGAKETTNQEKLSVFPNPVEDMVNFTLPESLNEYNFEVSDLTGRVVIKKSDMLNSGLNSLNISSLPHGIYFIHVIGRDKEYSAKMLKR